MSRTILESHGIRLIALMAIIIAGVHAITPAKAQTVAVDEALLKRLEQIIAQQQQQLNSQSGTIEALKARVDQLEVKSAETKSIATKAQSTATEARSAATEAQSAATVARSTAEEAVDAAEKTAAKVPDKIVTSGSENIKLAVSGHVNRAVNVANDGDKTKAYFVDNDTSNSRLRFVGTGKVTKDTTLGTTVEIAFSPNNSFDVSQDNEISNDFIDVRKVEAFVRNDSYGQLSFGKGQAAADDTAEYDLSLVAGPIMYSGVGDIVGGLQFVRNDALTGITVGGAFFNFDGDRQNRVRYDTPVFGPGLQFSGSAGADQRFDAALTWGGDYGDWTGVDMGPFTTLGAVSVQDLDSRDANWRLAGSFSALHNPTGISLTLSGGMNDQDDTENPFNLYGKIAYDISLFSVGPTGFGVDYTYGENISGQGDKATSVGVAAIQLIEDFGTEAYAQFRVYDLDRNNEESVEDIYVGTVGTRVKF